MKSNSDIAWFKANPDTNYRVRPPIDATEIDELARTLLPPDAAWTPGVMPDQDWRVLAIKLPLRRVARLLTLARADTDGDMHAMPVALGHRMAVV